MSVLKFSRLGRHITIPIVPRDELALARRVDLLLVVRRQAGRHFAVLAILVATGVGSLSMWNIARGKRISAIEAGLAELRLRMANDLADLRKICSHER